MTGPASSLGLAEALEAGSPRLQFRTSLSNSSSPLSTFSDISFSSPPSPPPSVSKTHAFFATPFPTRPHSPNSPTPPSDLSELPPQISEQTREIPLSSSPCNEPTPRPTSLVPAFPFTKPEIEPHPTSETPSKWQHSNRESPSAILPPPPLSSSASTSSTTSDSSSSSQTFITGQNTDTTLRLIHPLGHGSFSAVWLAEDFSPVSLTLKAKRRLRDLSRCKSNDRSSDVLLQALLQQNARAGLSDKVIDTAVDNLSRNASLKRLRARVRGTKPSRGTIRLQDGTYLVDERDGEMGIIAPDIHDSSESEDSFEIGMNALGLGAGLARVGSISGKVTSVASHEQRLKRKNLKESTGRLVAVKLTPRGASDPREAEKERVAFVREVEVLRHILHPNIAPLLSHLSTPTHYVLVFPYFPGGDLLGFLNSDAMWHKLGEDVLRRMWCEICKAVGWMHGVGLVHRDIKLENILLTTCAFSTLMPDSSRPTFEDLPAPPAPLIKLNDFGLSRFVDLLPNGEAELLVTRCGSEAYAAPELVTAGGRPRLTNVEGGSDMPKSIGVYDARETDAWACGVVLYALVVRKLPFGESAEDNITGGEAIANLAKAIGRSERRQWLMRIAKGEYSWPESGNYESLSSSLVGTSLTSSQGAKRIVGKLLVRDPAKRARIADLWVDPWMKGTGVDKDLPCTVTSANVQHDFVDELGSLEQQESGIQGVDEEKRWLEAAELQQLEQQEEQHGPLLVDEHAIHSITRQELDLPD
ncbi:Protein kinase-like domain containing protein [Amanita muscaria]